MNLGRRVVVSVALAAALAVIAGAVSHLVVESAGGGWFMYEPNGDGVPMGVGTSDGDTARVAVVWLIAIAIWFGVAWQLFRSRSGEPAGPGPAA